MKSGAEEYIKNLTGRLKRSDIAYQRAEVLVETWSALVPEEIRKEFNRKVGFPAELTLREFLVHAIAFELLD